MFSLGISEHSPASDSVSEINNAVNSTTTSPQAEIVDSYPQAAPSLVTAAPSTVTSTLRNFVLNLNLSQSEEFSAPGARLLRQSYRGKHPTQILALKCMDGRLNLALMTETPIGIIQPFRNIGGRFDLGWPFFGEIVNEEVERCVSRGKDILVFVTYHFSKGNDHRGCAGFGYDTESAHRHADDLQKQFKHVFGTTVVFPIVVGVETDEEALIFHGAGGAIYEVANNVSDTADQIHLRLMEIYPGMTSTIRNDLLPLIQGNQRYVQKVRATNRELVHLEHMENIIGVGRGFSWLHLPNKALLIGPYGHDWPSAVQTAGKIILSNMEAGRVDPADGVLLLVSALAHAEMGSSKWRVAEEKARYLERTARDMLVTTYPQIAGMLSIIVGVVDSSTMKLHPLSTRK